MQCVSYGGLIPPYRAMLEAFKFGLAICLGYLINLSLNQIQVSAYQTNLESQNKTLKADYSQCQSRVNQVKGIVEKW
ncbi:hypothetical protein PL9214830002 [Planktothrix tepida PCC 9214]|uniref:Uncharacterized protein n=1 Tax=Planktothrix tepida PCC 9214 TaxID=671072 RepID=A0A1J1LV97_9CYAN|nr:hypothetical protein [Planktothrix tepida]CUR36190.1 hypothetical protein PL9214830002 [Planktothrix tepida PCC 9214]